MTPAPLPVSEILATVRETLKKAGIENAELELSLNERDEVTISFTTPFTQPEFPEFLKPYATTRSMSEIEDMSHNGAFEMKTADGIMVELALHNMGEERRAQILGTLGINKPNYETGEYTSIEEVNNWVSNSSRVWNEVWEEPKFAELEKWMKDNYL